MSNRECCPRCQRPFPKPRAVKGSQPQSSQGVDTSTLNLDELRAFYKRIGTREDLRFWLKHADYLPDEIRAQGAALLAELETRDGKPQDAKRLQDLKRQAEPFYRQVCGHRHHTSLRTAYACKLDLLHVFKLQHEDMELWTAANQAIDRAMGWQ